VIKFKQRGRSRNLEDRRGRSGGMPMPGGGMAVGGGAGIVGVIIFLAIALLGGGGDGGFGAFGTGSQEVDPADEPLVDEMSAALDDIQEYWHEAMPWASGIPDYRDAKLVLFTSGVSTGCGNATSAIGPFYCPPDEKAYIDLSFFKELDRRFGAPGDFARVYVLAHEIGHHVQTVDGTNEAVRRRQQQNPGQANALSIRMELQADCYAGVWGHSARQRGLLEPGDVQEGLDAAAAVGDDRVGAGSPESWTHGSSEQRMEWFTRGFESGDPAVCDTFRADP
jgi:uncharacterized protein